MRMILLAVAMVGVALGGWGCNRSPAATGGKANTANQLYIEVSAASSLPYFEDHKAGMKLAGEVLGVRTEYVGPATLDIPAMATALEQAIAKQPAGLVVVGFDSQLEPIINKAVDAGIPVVTVDADLPGSKRVAFVGTGNAQAGYQGGKKLASVIGGKGQVALLTKVGQSNLEERVAGYRKALTEFPGISIVQVEDTKSDPIEAARRAAALLQRFPDLAGIGCVEAAGGMGAATAVREGGRAGKIKIVAMDRDNDVLEQIKNGVISASVAQQTRLMPLYATQILYNLKNHPAAISSDNAKAGVSGVPAVIDTGVVIIDQGNWQYFLRK